MAGLSNVAVLAGDAHGILRDALPSGGAAEVHTLLQPSPLHIHLYDRIHIASASASTSLSTLLLQSCLKTARARAQVHVNFPQPPQWEQSEAHLVNRAFLAGVHRILLPGLTLTLTLTLTDAPHSAA